MKPDTYAQGCNRLLAGIFKLITTMGLTIMIASNANGAQQFILKAPQKYFSDTGTLALLDAALAGNLSRAQQLVAAGADPNDDGPKDNPYNRIRLLHYAIAANNGSAVRVLMAVGSNPEMDTEGLGPALLFTITLENMKMMSLLLDLKPVASLEKSTLKTLLFESEIQPCRQCIELLLERGAPIDFQDRAGYTIMMRAMDSEDYDLAEWLIEQGASVLVEAKGGATPAYAVQYYLKKFRPGTPTHDKVLHLKELMEKRGAVFPALSPKEKRAMRAAGK